MAESFDVVFQGNSESECTDFIRAVRKYAGKNQKIEDNKWIADELYDAFDGVALRWYVRLPVNVRRDWELLQQALVVRWIPDEDDNPRATLPPPPASPFPAAAAAATSPPSSSFSSTFVQSGQVGRVRMPVNGKSEVRCLSKNVVKKGDPGTAKADHRLGIFGITTDAALAMKVRFIVTGPKAHRLELVEYENNFPVLAALAYHTNDWNNIKCWCHLVGVDGPGQGSLKDRRTTYNGPDRCKARQFWTDRWQLESTGRLKLYGPGDKAEAARFTLGINSDNKDILWFHGPKTPANPSVMELDLEFEPL